MTRPEGREPGSGRGCPSATLQNVWRMAPRKGPDPPPGVSWILGSTTKPQRSGPPGPDEDVVFPRGEVPGGVRALKVAKCLVI